MARFLRDIVTDANEDFCIVSIVGGIACVAMTAVFLRHIGCEKIDYQGYGMGAAAILLAIVGKKYSEGKRDD